MRRLAYDEDPIETRKGLMVESLETQSAPALAAIDAFVRGSSARLHDLTASLGNSGGEIDVVCGYRTPWSNEFLRTRRPHTGVAQHSLHMQAEAIDIRLPGIPTSELRDAALRLHRGGVGYYRSSDFVHVDVGRVRRW